MTEPGTPHLFGEYIAQATIPKNQNLTVGGAPTVSPTTDAQVDQIKE